LKQSGNTVSERVTANVIYLY